MRRHGLDEQAHGDLVALCQFLPRPASSQVGFSIGLTRAGCLGGGAAWIGFTLLSAIALFVGFIGQVPWCSAVGTLPFWETFRCRAGVQAVFVVSTRPSSVCSGLALYSPIWTNTVKTQGEFGLALEGFVLLVAWRAPPWIVVLISTPAPRR